MKQRRRSLGRCVDESVRESTEEWFRQHGGFRSREDAKAEDWRKLNVTTDLVKGGYLTVYVGIVTTSRNSTQMDIWHYRWSDSTGFVRVEKRQATG